VTLHQPFEVERREDAVHFEFWYPRNEGQPHTLEIGLMDVRAADCIRVIYDFDRDGWSILQASTFEWEDAGPDAEYDEDWQEVAFVPAWAREKKVR